MTKSEIEPKLAAQERRRRKAVRVAPPPTKYAVENATRRGALNAAPKA